jgi:threonine/homoserine/homoserine lactone efflux protein
MTHPSGFGRLKPEERCLALYSVFVLMAVLTIVSPGPGVLKSLTNALQYGLRPALIGIAGLACGVFCVAALAATSLGALLSASATAFHVIRIAGAAYLLYLGVRLWRAPTMKLAASAATAKRRRTLFVEGWLLQFSNPNALFFFLSVLPQFIDRSHPYLPQFLLLVLTFCLLLVVVHGSYACGARHGQRWLAGTAGAGRWLNRGGGAAFVIFSVLLLNSGRPV